jgi:DNA-binding CsgD family transcriptional regulator
MQATSAEIVGREEALGAIETFLDALPSAASALVLEGEAGIGKTTLWTAGVERARDRGDRVLACRPSEAEAALPFVSLGDLLEPVLADTACLPAPQRVALETALALVAPSEAFGRLAVARAALALLRGLAAAGPVVIAIDDVQWLDPATAGIVEFSARRLEREPVGFLLARRADRRAPAPLGLAQALQPEATETLRVGPLSVAGLDRLLRSRLDLGLPRPRLLELHRVSGGNPFYAVEIARAVTARGDLDDDSLAVPETLAELLRGRLDALSPGGRDAVLVTAAACQPTVPLVEKSAGGSAGLAEAVTEGIVVLDRQRIRFSHPLLASVSYDAAPLWERRDAHRRLAESATDLEEQAHHLALASSDPDETVAGTLEEAAAVAASRGAPEAAAGLAEHAARLTPSAAVADRRRRLAQAAEFHTASGDPARGRELLERLIAELPPGPDRADLLCRFADVVIDVAESIRLCEQAAAEAGSDPALGARIETALGVFTWIAGDLARSAEHSRASAELAERAGDGLLLAVSLGELCHAQTVLCLPTRPGDMERALELERELEGFPPYMRPSFQLGVIHTYRDEPDEARPLLDAELRRIEAAGDESTRPGILFRIADLEVRAGNWARAARAADECLALALQAGTEQEQSVGLMIHALVRAHLGDVEEAADAASESLALAGRIGDRIIAVRSTGVLGFTALSTGDVPAAADLLGPARDELQRLGTGELSISGVVQNEIEALVALGLLEEAERTIAFVEEKGRPTRRAWHEAIAHRGRALLAGAEGDFERAREHVDRSLRAHGRLPQPFELARTRLVQGQIERRAKRRGLARDSITSALQLFDQLGAARWAEKAAAELARIPGRPRGTGELTETERRVAELVADGLSNKQVAARLFVTVRAVEANLSRIYAKLGVRSRTELARRLSRRIDT